MDDVVTVHLKVPRVLWMALRRDAMDRGRSAQEHVMAMFRVAYGSSEGRVMPSPVMPVSAPKKVGVVAAETAEEFQGRTELKAGYGWCKACRVEQVKLPKFLCGKCEKL